mmetsp:Transcript_83519/g.269228  ORF Transcript_83519/g.269228 Transcript_83519/m.269228 type:complete len:210 (-) Transcript_83519:752-1381(-)
MCWFPMASCSPWMGMLLRPPGRLALTARDARARPARSWIRTLTISGTGPATSGRRTKYLRRSPGDTGRLPRRRLRRGPSRRSRPNGSSPTPAPSRCCRSRLSLPTSPLGCSSSGTPWSTGPAPMRAGPKPGSSAATTTTRRTGLSSSSPSARGNGRRGGRSGVTLPQTACGQCCSQLRRSRSTEGRPMVGIPRLSVRSSRNWPAFVVTS